MKRGARMESVHAILDGTRVGDAFGQRFLEPGSDSLAENRQAPAPPWTYTDDSVLSYALAQHLVENDGISNVSIAADFVSAWEKEPDRGYGASAARLFRQIAEGGDSQVLAKSQFDGMGSAGNGSAMRTAVVGAWYSGAASVVEAARVQSQVSHTHEEAVDGAIAVSLAAFFLTDPDFPASELIPALCKHLPQGTIASRLNRAQRLRNTKDVRTIVSAVGTSTSLLARDTVPFCIWAASRHCDSYEDAIWACVDAGGDVDTTCAIAGALVAARGGSACIPEQWLAQTEPWAGGINVARFSSVA